MSKWALRSKRYRRIESQFQTRGVVSQWAWAMPANGKGGEAVLTD